MYCLFMEGSQLFTCFASQTQWQTPSLSFQKNIPSVVHFYTNRWSMLVLSQPSQRGEMWKKKGEVVYLWCDLTTQENTVCVCHGKQTQWKESLLFTSGNSKHFLFVCRHTGKRLATQDCFIGPEYPGDLGMSRRFMLDRPLKGLRNVKKSPGKFCHRIFCPGIK